MSGSTEIVAGNWADGIDPARLEGAREATLWVVERALAGRRPAGALRETVAGRLDARDRALLHQLTSGVLRWLLRLDHAIATIGRRPIGTIDPELLGPLRLGAYQLFFLDRVPRHAAVDTSVELAKRRHRRGVGFVNAVLRRLAEIESLGDLQVEEPDPIDRLAVETSHPRFLVERWVRLFGEEKARRVLTANNRERRASLLSTGGAAVRQELIEELDREGVAAVPSTLSPVGLLVERGRPLSTAAFSRGALYPQDEASQCAAVIPLPTAGERVLDAAAAPGGKTLSLLSWQPDLDVVAADRSVRRLVGLSANRHLARRPFELLTSDAVRPAVRGGFDRVIADLPCSGTGTIRKHPELKWRVGAAELARLTSEAASILDGLTPLVAHGGVLVVVTCSIEPEENEAQIASYLERHPGVELLDLRGRVHEAAAPWLETPYRWRLLPGGEHDGFTVHALRAMVGS